MLTANLVSRTAISLTEIQPGLSNVPSKAFVELQEARCATSPHGTAPIVSGLSDSPNASNDLFAAGSNTDVVQACCSADAKTSAELVAKEKANREWTALAAGLAGRGRVRVSRDRGKNYKSSDEKDLTLKRPVKPAAVMVYAENGTCRTLFLDLDSSDARGGIAQVDTDAESLRRWIAAAGGLWIEDTSPSAGRHIYIPLKEPVTQQEAMELLGVLSSRHPSLDVSPHSSAVSGCCRVPGSAHKSGGFQTLTHSLGEAVQAVRDRNPKEVWERLWAETKTDREAVSAMRSEQLSTTPSASQENTIGALSVEMFQVVRHGQWKDLGRYQSPSEARMGAITGAARAGYSFLDVQQKILNGDWPGLAGLYAKYTAQEKQKTLRYEWSKAILIVESTQIGAAKKTVRKSDTSQERSRGGGPKNDDLALWRGMREDFESSLKAARESQALRMVLRAIEEAAAKTRAMEIFFGSRSLAQATGLHHSTVASHLHTLAGRGAPIIRTAKGKGLEADTWTLTIPEAAQDPSRPVQRRPRVHAVRPAFRELGLPAAFAYEALENATEPLTADQIAQNAMIGRSSAYEALETLSDWGLAVWSPQGWRLGRASLKAVAGKLGADEDAAAQADLHRRQRDKWIEVLENSNTTLIIATPETDYPYWDYDPGPDIPEPATTPPPPDEETPMPTKAFTPGELETLARTLWDELAALEDDPGAGMWEKTVAHAIATTAEHFANTPAAF